MSRHSANLAQSKYRRGTILGLTVAEIFILLLFLLMLVFLVLSQEQTQRLEQQKQEMEQLQVFRETWEESLVGIETPDEIVALKRWRDSVTNSQRNETERLLSQLMETEQERNELEARSQELAQEKERLIDESTKQQEKLEEQQKQLENLQQQNENYLEIAEEQRILRERGQNPPCWYEIVPAANGGTREKAHYVFDIAIFDEHMVIRKRAVPPGGALNDSDRTYATYAEEAALLPLEEIRYSTPLADNEMIELLSPLFIAGKESRVRTYSCVFFVKVWDETSEFAKERWQQAHDNVLEGLFGTFTVRDESWQLL